MDITTEQNVMETLSNALALRNRDETINILYHRYILDSTNGLRAPSFMRYSKRLQRNWRFKFQHRLSLKIQYILDHMVLN